MCYATYRLTFIYERVVMLFKQKSKLEDDALDEHEVDEIIDERNVLLLT